VVDHVLQHLETIEAFVSDIFLEQASFNDSSQFTNFFL